MRRGHQGLLVRITTRGHLAACGSSPQRPAKGARLCVASSRPLMGMPVPLGGASRCWQAGCSRHRHPLVWEMDVQSIPERISDAMANGCEQLLLRARIGGEAPHILCSQLEPGHGVRQTGSRSMLPGDSVRSTRSC